MTTTIRGITALARELGAWPKSIYAALERGELKPIGVERGKPIFDLETCRKRWAASANYRAMQARGGGRRPLACSPQAAEGDEVDVDVVVGASNEPFDLDDDQIRELEESLAEADHGDVVPAAPVIARFGWER
jgi:hypothetical protein